jgi:hypothetical protein
MRKYLFLSVLFLGLNSCKNEINKGDQVLGYTIIDVGSDIGKGRIVDLSEIASDITYIPLETTSDSFCGGYPVVIYENDRIYVRGAGVIKVFDKSGKYLFTFDRIGRGPEEYPHGAPWIEKGTGNFYIESFKGRSKVVKTYYRDGTFKKDIIMPYGQDMFLRLRRYLTNCYVCNLIPWIAKDEKEYFAILFDSLSNVRGYIPPPPIDTRLISNNKKHVSLPEGVKLLIPSDKYNIGSILQYFKDSIRVYTSYGDTIYSYRDSNILFPRYVMDYGKYTPSKIYINQEGTNWDKQITLDNGFYYETDKFLLLNYRLRDYAHEPFRGKRSYLHLNDQVITESYGYYNKITKRFSLLNHPLKNRPGFREDIHQGPPFVPVYLSDDNFMLAPYYPHDLIDYASNNKVSQQLQKVINVLTENDNIVIALVKLK